MIAAVWRKDLAALWSTPIPYVVAALYQAVLGLLFLDQLQARQQALVQPLFPLAGFLLLATVPILTMRSLAEEERSGTLELLFAVPVPPAVIVVGKWLAAATTLIAAVAPAVAYAGLVELYGDPDGGPLVAGFLALALLVLTLSALGVLASALTASPPVAAMASFVAGSVLWFAGTASASVSVAGVLSRLSLSERLRSAAGGVIDLADVGFFVAATLACLGAAVAVVEVRRVR